MIKAKCPLLLSQPPSFPTKCHQIVSMIIETRVWWFHRSDCSRQLGFVMKVAPMVEFCMKMHFNLLEAYLVVCWYLLSLKVWVLVYPYLCETHLRPQLQLTSQFSAQWIFYCKGGWRVIPFLYKGTCFLSSIVFHKRNYHIAITNFEVWRNNPTSFLHKFLIPGHD